METRTRRSSSLPSGVLSSRIYRPDGGLLNEIVWSPKGSRIAAASSHGEVLVWECGNSEVQARLRGHRDQVMSVAWIDEQTLLSASARGTVLRWDIEARQFRRLVEGHGSMAWQMAVQSSEASRAAIGCDDGSIVLFNTRTGQVDRRFEESGRQVFCLAWHPEDDAVSFGCAHGHVLIGDVEREVLQRRLKCDDFSVRALAWSPGGSLLASGTSGGRIDLWDPHSGNRKRALEGHTGFIYGLSFHNQLPLLASRASDGTTKIWNSKTWRLLVTIADPTSGINLTGGLCFSPSENSCSLIVRSSNDSEFKTYELNVDTLLATGDAPPTAFYRNAKVVVVGDSGAGKTSLTRAICGRAFQATESTHGRVVSLLETHMALADDGSTETRETFLWDFAGQSSYGTVQQLHLGDADVAILVFDAGDENPFGRVRYWLGALLQSGGTGIPVVLVAARNDLGGLHPDRNTLGALAEDHGLLGPFETSAKQGHGIRELVDTLRAAVDWETLTRVSSTRLFHKIRTFVRVEAASGIALTTLGDLRRSFLQAYPEFSESNTEREFQTCLDLLSARGVVKRLSFGSFVLLQPEVLDQYAAAMLRSVRELPDRSGTVEEETVFQGRLAMPEHQRIADQTLEKPLLIATVEEMKRHDIAIRERGMLVFPSALSPGRPPAMDELQTEAFFEFPGSAEVLYARIAVGLSRGKSFRRQCLWRGGAVFESRHARRCALEAQQTPEGPGRIVVAFDSETRAEDRSLFLEYVQEPIEDLAWHRFQRILACRECALRLSDEQVERGLEQGRASLSCPLCSVEIEISGSVTSSGDLVRDAALRQRIEANRHADVASTVVRGKRESGDYDVFMCYNTEDREFVRGVYSQLCAEGVLPWLDEEDLQPGRVWIDELGRILDRIGVAAVFVGPQSLNRWAGVEFRQLLRRFVESDTKIIPVVLPGVAETRRLDFLDDFQRVDFRQREPDPLQRLLWGILGRGVPRS